MSHRVLIIDDERGIQQALRQVLEYEGLEVRVAASGGEGLTLYPQVRPHVVFLDLKMAGLDGLETLQRIRDLDPDALVVMISGHGTIATAVDATRRGAFDFLEKPLDTDRLLVTLRNALAQAELRGENDRLRGTGRTGRYQMVGQSAALGAVREIIARVGPTNARVLITGANGSGKELVARAVHEASPRRNRPFVEVNCAAIPSELIESELFGHMKGSFTGAFSDRAGKFELADGGTLFLDEVGDMSMAAQAKVLRALQEGVVTRLGGARAKEVDVRVLAATNKDLAIEIEEGRFREDLFYRLNVVPIEVPALWERREDIPELVAHFAAELGGTAGAGARRFGDDAIRLLRSWPWPGNVRELRNAVERLLILSTGRTVTAADVERLLPRQGFVEPGPMPDPSGGHASLESVRERSERAYVLAMLRDKDWNITDAARELGMPRSSLYRRIEKYGLTRDST